MCTVDKNSLRCGKRGLTGHVTEACRGGRRSIRTPSRTRWSKRSPSSSSDSSSSSAEERRRRKKKEKKEKRKSREEKKNKNRTWQRASSGVLLLPLPAGADPRHVATSRKQAELQSPEERTVTQ